MTAPSALPATASRTALIAIAGTIIAVVWLYSFALFILIMGFRFSHFLHHAAITVDPPCTSPACDFSAFWSAGTFAGRHDFVGLYNAATLHGFQLRRLSPLAAGTPFFYPPTMLLLLLAVARLPFELGYFVWDAALALFSAALLRRAGLSWLVIACGLCSPAALDCLQLGQAGIFAGAVLVSGLLLAGRGAVGAGWLGVLVIKPQYGVLLPVALLARPPRTALVATTAAACGLMLLTLATFGPASWFAYVKFGLPESRRILQAAFDPATDKGTGVSVFWMLRSVHGGLAEAYGMQFVATALAGVLTWRVWRSSASGLDRMALTVFLSLLATPYGYTDDMVAYSIALAALAQRNGWRLGLLDALFWLWPALCPIFATTIGILFTPVVVALAVARTWRAAGLGWPWPGLVRPALPRPAAPHPAAPPG